MTAVTDAVIVSGGGVAARRAARNARIRGLAFGAVGLVAFSFASQGMETSTTFSFWIDAQGGDSATLQTSAGVLWIVAGLASLLIAALQLVRSTEFRCNQVFWGHAFLWRDEVLRWYPIIRHANNAISQ